MKFTSLIPVLALAAVASPAAADSFAANLSGSYANFAYHGGQLWNVDGAAQATVDQAFGIEVTGGYHRSGFNSGIDLANGGGSLFWRGEDIVAAVTVNYIDLSLIHVTTYGAGAEWFADDHWTLAARGGGLSGQFGVTGGYGGGAATYYVLPDLSLTGSVDYTNLAGFDHVTSEALRAEWLMSETTPISVFGGVGHADSGSVGSVNVFFVGVRLYLNDGSTTLVDRQRNGNLGFISSVPYYAQEL